MLALTGLVMTSVLLLSFAVYLVHHAILLLCSPRDLAKLYPHAKWALVTGSSTGIGRALANKLASQGLNVVLVALANQHLDAAVEELQAAYPKLQFRKVGADLSRADCLETISAATGDIEVPIIFNNAGYMLTGFFDSRPLEEHMANLHCNAVSAVAITHHFLERMVAGGQTGCFVFTSSAAAAMPSPFTVLYAATKSFLSSFGAGLAAEVRHRGIDVLVVHPSPVRSNFYDKAHKLGVLDFFKSMAVPPEALPDAILAGIGRTVWLDIGLTALAFRLAMKVLDYNFMACTTALVAPWMPDFKQQIKANQLKREQKRPHNGAK